MDLNTILKKTKNTSDRIKRNRVPVHIATADRPYESSPPENNHAEQKEVTKNLRQTEDKLKTNLRQTEDKVETQLRTQLETKLGQNRGDLEPNLTTQYGFQSLVGLQRKLLIFMYQQSQLHRDKVTPPLSIENIATACNTTTSSSRKTLQRLENKALLIRKYFKNGRGGWTQYELPKGVYQELLHVSNYKQFETNLGQSGDKVETQLRTQLRTTPFSSSSIINKTTTTSLPEEWLKISLDECQIFGLTQSHLLQLYKAGDYDPKIVEDSIQYFLFDLEHNNKIKDIKTNPLSYFMGIIKRSGAYTAPDNYETPKDRAMRIYLERQKVIQEKKAIMEKECLNIEFKKWVGNLNEQEKNRIIPNEAKKMNLEGPKIAALHSHFEKTVWEAKKKELLEVTLRKEV